MGISEEVFWEEQVATVDSIAIMNGAFKNWQQSPKTY